MSLVQNVPHVPVHSLPLAVLAVAGAYRRGVAESADRPTEEGALAAVRTMNRLECVGETLRAALNGLAVEAPQWLKTVADPEWFPRY
jgi:hypothetical protein